MFAHSGGVKQTPITDFGGALPIRNAQEMRVLLAEDTPINAEAMKAMAAHLSVEMETASNGFEAIEMVEQAKADGTAYSLLFVDVMMPVLDGIETTRRLRSRGFAAKDLPIIAVTAATSFDEIRAYKACGMQAFLAKPVALADLRATFEAWGHASDPAKPDPIARIEPAVLAALKEQFGDRNQRTLGLIEAALGEDAINPALIEEIRNLLHQIAGTATTFGDPPLSTMARAQEHALIEAHGSPEKLRQSLEEAAKCLRQRVQAS